jgi:hypothetical protein
MSWNELSAILGSKIEATSFNFAPMRYYKRTKTVAGSTGRPALSSEIEKYRSFHRCVVARTGAMTRGDCRVLRDLGDIVFSQR